MLLRRGNAGSNTATDHITVLRSALRQLPANNQPGHRSGRCVLICIDGAGSTHGLLDWLTARNLSYSVGFGLPDRTPELLKQIHEPAWSPALDADGQVRDGAWAAELTGLLELGRWPTGMRVIARVERPHPGAQLRVTDADGSRVTAFATNTRPAAQITDLELRHRHRARCKDRIRAAKDTGLRNLPLHGLDQNRIWCQIVQLAGELLAWTPDARLRRAPRPGLGTQTAAATTVFHRPPPCLARPPPRAAPRRRSPLERTRPHRATCDHRAPGPTRLTHDTASISRHGTPTGPWTQRHRPNSGDLVVPLGHHHPGRRPPSRETPTHIKITKNPG